MLEPMYQTASRGAIASVVAAERTSRNDPLWIGDLPVPGLPGQIGLTILPGRKAARPVAGGAPDRDLEADMREAAAWGPGLGLSLPGPHHGPARRAPAFPPAT